MSVASRVVDALFQGLAARASGFAIVPIANMAPALQFLYVIMMYIAIYPVRRTSIPIFCLSISARLYRSHLASDLQMCMSSVVSTT